MQALIPAKEHLSNRMVKLVGKSEGKRLKVKASFFHVL